LGTIFANIALAFDGDNARTSCPCGSLFSARGRTLTEQSKTKLKKLFSEKVGQMGSELAGYVAGLQPHTHPIDQMDSIYRIAHSLHGAGSMYGFPKISELGASLERVALAVKSGRISLNDSTLALIRKVAQALQEPLGQPETVCDADCALTHLAWECECLLRPAPSADGAEASISQPS
jgi:chemotaxis protein histidine kinase CheA